MDKYTTSGVSTPHAWLDAVQVQRYDSLYDSTPSATVTLGEALDVIATGVYAAAIQRVRQIRASHGDAAYKHAKTALPQFTLCGTFQPSRAKDHLQTHSGVVHADIDHLADLHTTKLLLMQDLTVVYIFTSPSAAGLKVGVRVAPVTTDEAYKHAWQTVCDQHQERYGITWDPSGKDVCRTCYVSVDPSIFINPDARVVEITPPAPPEPPPKVTAHLPYLRQQTQDAASRALAWAVRLIESAPDHEKHHARCRAAYLVGGYIGSGHLDYDAAYSALAAAVRSNTTKETLALKDLVSGLEAGQRKPLVPQRPIPQMFTVNAKEVPPWHV